MVDGCKVYSYSNMSVIPYILKVGLKKYANVMKMKCSFKEKTGYNSYKWYYIW